VFKKIFILTAALAIFALGYSAGSTSGQSAHDKQLSEMDIVTRAERISYIPANLRTDREMSIVKSYLDKRVNE
jgi:hypothetical protein